MKDAPGASTDHVNNFDLIRHVAASLVMFGHISAHLALPLSSGAVNALLLFNGVVVFFVVSGFLVTGSFLRTEKLSSFTLKRVLRIYPGLWGNLCVIILLLIVGGSFSPQGSIRDAIGFIVFLFGSGSDIVASVFFFQPIGPGGFYDAFPSGILWTIPIELGFYALVPLIFAQRILRTTASLGFWFLASLIIAFLNTKLTQQNDISAPATLLRLSPLPYLWIFLLGGIVQLHWSRLRPLFEGTAFIWVTAYCALVWAQHYFFGVPFDLNPMLIDWPTVGRIVVLAGAVIALAYTYKSASSWITCDLSYGIYLYHMQIIYTLKMAGIVANPVLWILVPAAALLTAFASWSLIEKPALRWKPFKRAKMSGQTAAEIN